MNRLGNLALFLFSLALCLTGLEGYYHFFFAESDGFGQLSRNFAARYYRYDQFGLRGSNLPPSETELNLVFAGDSFVFGHGLKSINDRFSNKVAGHYPNLHVINIGFMGWDTKTETSEVKRFLGETKAAIPLVVLTYFFNDIEEDITPADRARLIPVVMAPKPSTTDKVFQALSKQSRFIELFYYRFVYPRLVSSRLDQILMFYNDAEIVGRHLASLEEFRSMVSNQYGARLLLIVLPYLHSDQLLHDNAFYERFRNRLNEHRFEYIDMQPIFANYTVKKLQVNRFDPHTNAFANDLIADAVLKHLSQYPEDLRPQREDAPNPN